MKCEVLVGPRKQIRSIIFTHTQKPTHLPTHTHAHTHTHKHLHTHPPPPTHTHLHTHTRTHTHTQIYRVRHKSVNIPLSHERLAGGLQDGGRGTHVTHFIQLYPQPLYTASQVRTTCRSWDEGVFTDVCLTGVLTD